MLHLSRQSLALDKKQWQYAGIKPYDFSAKNVMESTRNNPQWLHFGGGNIFRAYIARLQQELIEKSKSHTGIVVTTAHNKETITKLYRPYDNLSVAVTMHADGKFTKEVIGSIVESLFCSIKAKEDWRRLQEIASAPSLQIISFTITEKAYKLKNYNNVYFTDVVTDMQSGPEKATTVMGCVASLLYSRYKTGKLPITLLSMDNCSHNGDKIKEAMFAFAKKWIDNKLVDKGFIDYLQDTKKVAFPWSMIDKITPHPSAKVREELQKCGLEDMDLITTEIGEYSLFTNAEKTEYLVIEDNFPNGRPPLEDTGVIFTDKATVDKVEHMKVCTCLNPLHTTLAVYGCLLGYTLIADEMNDVQLKSLIKHIGYDEGLPVVVDPKVLDPKQFLTEVIEKRVNNPNVPDTPQRIATDTSQKVSIRFGETIKAYGEKASELKYIPLAIAGWCRYLLGIDDKGENFTISADPMLDYLQEKLAGVKIGDTVSARGKLTDILSNKSIFGVDLYAVGLGKVIEEYFAELIASKGAVRNTLKKYVK